MEGDLEKAVVNKGGSHRPVKTSAPARKPSQGEKKQGRKSRFNNNTGKGICSQGKKIPLESQRGGTEKKRGKGTWPVGKTPTSEESEG